MEQNETVWAGVSGNTYHYWYYELNSFQNLKSKPGNYIFAKINSSNQWEPVYIGETEDLNERFSQHEKWDCIERNGATHVHAHLSSVNRQSRLDEETDMRNEFNTACNDQ